MSLILIVFCVFSVIWCSNRKQQQDRYTDRSIKFAELREQQPGVLDLQDFNQPYYEPEQGWSCLRSPIAVNLEFVLLPLETSHRRMLASGAIQGIQWPADSEWALLGPDHATTQALVESPVGKWLHAITFPVATQKRGKSATAGAPLYEVKAIRLRGGVLSVFFAKEYGWEELGKFREHRQNLKTALLAFGKRSQGNLHNPLSQSFWLWYLTLLSTLIYWNYQISPISQFWDFPIHWGWLLVPLAIVWKCSGSLLEFFDRYQLSPKVSAQGMFLLMVPWLLLWFWLLLNEYNIAFSPARTHSKQWYVLSVSSEGRNGPWFAEILPKQGTGYQRLPINQKFYDQLQGGEQVEIRYLRGAFGKPWICRIEIEQKLYYQFLWKTCTENSTSAKSQLTDV
ncbi:hypothetical protein [Rheinheimera texasensis]|uniref:hypothetical protein n=1 Tax=Rheinheimera texasensis TaxID=306205 RepID=UPI0004E0BB0E|nr:hypothetical protein [Rheinheimera texasensis]